MSNRVSKEGYSLFLTELLGNHTQGIDLYAGYNCHPIVPSAPQWSRYPDVPPSHCSGLPDRNNFGRTHALSNLGPLALSRWQYSQQVPVDRRVLRDRHGVDDCRSAYTARRRSPDRMESRVWTTSAISITILGVLCNWLCYRLDAHYFHYFGGAESPTLFIANGIVMSAVGGLLIGWLLFVPQGQRPLTTLGAKPLEIRE